MKKLPPPANYDDRALIMKSKAFEAEITTINKALAKYDSVIDRFEQEAIDAVNMAREIGIHFQTLCQHELIDADFWRDNCEGKIKCDYDRARAFVSFSRKMPEAATTIMEAAHYIQQALQAGGKLLISERAESQFASKVSIFEKFFNEITLLIQPFKKAIRDVPMEEWSRPILEKFVSETEFFHLEHERAVKLLWKGVGK